MDSGAKDKATQKKAEARTMIIHKGAELDSYSRGLDQIIIHESVTTSTARTVGVLKRRKLGVHFCIDRDEAGTITNHVPVALACAHAGKAHNKRAIGLEIVNRYYGRYAEGAPTIQAVWAHKGSYILPLEVQLEQAFLLVEFLCDLYKLPRVFPCIRGDVFKWGRNTLHRRKPGILAHHRFGHADGLFIEHYLASRFLLGLSHPEAWELTLKHAQGGRKTPFP